jgi:hypothetical protein
VESLAAAHGHLGLPLIGRRCEVVGSLIIEDSNDHDDPEAKIYEGVHEHPFGARLFGLPST